MGAAADKNPGQGRQGAASDRLPWFDILLIILLLVSGTAALAWYLKRLPGEETASAATILPGAYQTIPSHPPGFPPELAERYDQVAMIESPIPQGDVAGNGQIHRQISRPIAMHYGQPPIMTALQQDVCDGFVVGGSAGTVLRQAQVCEAANKPLWLQLVGTGLTTAWAAHLGAVVEQAKWPAISCLNIYASSLLTPPIQVQGGFYRVPDGPGLGVTINEAALARYRVDYSFLEPPRHLYRYIRANGVATYYGCGKQALADVYVADAQPIAEPGATLEVVPDDGSAGFAELYARVGRSHTVRRVESA